VIEIRGRYRTGELLQLWDELVDGFLQVPTCTPLRREGPQCLDFMTNSLQLNRLTVFPIFAPSKLHL
jgi:hypothetical protein